MPRVPQRHRLHRPIDLAITGEFFCGRQLAECVQGGENLERPPGKGRTLNGAATPAECWVHAVHKSHGVPFCERRAGCSAPRLPSHLFRADPPAPGQDEGWNTRAGRRGDVGHVAIQIFRWERLGRIVSNVGGYAATALGLLGRGGEVLDLGGRHTFAAPVFGGPEDVLDVLVSSERV